MEKGGLFLLSAYDRLFDLVHLSLGKKVVDNWRNFPLAVL